MQKRAVLQSAQAGNANGTPFDFTGVVNLAIQVDVAAFTGTVNFEGSLDNVNWYPVPLQSSTGAWVSTATAGGMFVTNVAPYPMFRARTSGVTAGTVTVTAFAEIGA